MLSVRARDPGAPHPDRAPALVGWQPWSGWSGAGPDRERIPVPAPDGRWRLILVEGGAR